MISWVRIFSGLIIGQNKLSRRTHKCSKIFWNLMIFTCSFWLTGFWCTWSSRASKVSSSPWTASTTTRPWRNWSTMMMHETQQSNYFRCSWTMGKNTWIKSAWTWKPNDQWLSYLIIYACVETIICFSIYYVIIIHLLTGKMDIW